MGSGISVSSDVKAIDAAIAEAEESTIKSTIDSLTQTDLAVIAKLSEASKAKIEAAFTAETPTTFTPGELRVQMPSL